MKKVLALVLSLMLMMSGVAVFAEATEENVTVQEPITIDLETAPFEPAWIEFEDGFAMMLPSDWLELEITDELLEAGIFYAVVNAEQTASMQVAWAEIELETVEDLAADLATAYAGVEILTINEIAFVSYTIEESDSIGICALDGMGGMYVFNFYPASDEAFMTNAAYIMASIHNVAEEEEAAEE